MPHTLQQPHSTPCNLTQPSIHFLIKPHTILKKPQNLILTHKNFHTNSHDHSSTPTNPQKHFQNPTNFQPPPQTPNNPPTNFQPPPQIPNNPPTNSKQPPQTPNHPPTDSKPPPHKLQTTPHHVSFRLGVDGVFTGEGDGGGNDAEKNEVTPPRVSADVVAKNTESGKSQIFNLKFFNGRINNFKKFFYYLLVEFVEIIKNKLNNKK